MPQSSPGLHETTPVCPNAFGRMVLMSVGWILVGVGVVGMFLPILPTTCFLLGAGWCFARSSPRFEGWLYANRLFGRYLRDYTESRLLPQKIKIVSLVTLWGSISFSIFIVPSTTLRIGLITVAAAVTLHLARLKTIPDASPGDR